MKRPASRAIRLGPAEIALSIGLLVAGGAALAWAAGWLAPARPSGPPPGTVAVPAAAVPIAAYEQVELRHLLGRDGDLSVVYLPEGSILPDTVTRPDELIGRVMAADKAAGLLFTRKDFLPAGTRPGLVAGIPPGKRALRVDAAQVAGIAGLARGDRFDLVATEKPGASATASASAAARRARARVLVEAGVVVEPLATRPLAAASGPRVVEEIVIAVTSDEVAALTEALAAGARIDCVPRSGRPDALDEEPRAKRGGSWDGLRNVERISGSRRELLSVPEARPDLGPLADDPPLVSAAPPADAFEAR